MHEEQYYYYAALAHAAKLQGGADAAAFTEASAGVPLTLQLLISFMGKHVYLTCQAIALTTSLV